MELPALPGPKENGQIGRPDEWSAKIVENGSLTPGIYYPNEKRNRVFRFGGLRKLKRRAVQKNGVCNVLQAVNSRRRLRYFLDIFTTLVDTQWRWTLIVFVLSFIFSWLGFAVLWWIIVFTHGDLDPAHLPAKQSDANWKPCVTNINDFTSCFLYSIETQHTIGYGSRLPNEECPEAITMVCIQSIFGVMMQAFMVGIVFAKMTRPKHRTQTLLFSKCAVICQRDGVLCLMFRVADMRKSHIIGAGIRAQMIRNMITKEGECLSQYQTQLELKADDCNADLFLIWPQTVVHTIDSSSPLYSYSANDIIQDRFEIVVILEGTVESTGQSTQARTSYISSEILWGHRFEPLVSYNKMKHVYQIDYSKYQETARVNTPLCSGKDLDAYYKLQEEDDIQDNEDNVSVRKAPPPDIPPPLETPVSS